MHEAIALGFSSCPNDTFMFDALVHRRVDVGGIDLRVVMEDIETLNERALGRGGGRLPVTKLSVAAAGRVLEDYRILGAGAALGRGCGPLVVAPEKRAGVRTLADLAGRRVAIPGAGTTAHLLLTIFGPGTFERVQMRFDEVMPAVAQGRCDAGLIIHESRFTYPDFGLVQVADLGERWEAETGLPLPLGVIVAARTLPDETIRAVEAGIAASVRHAWDHPTDSAAYVRAHAQEMDSEVCRQHIDLYVNAFSAELGEQGRAAIEALLERGRAVGLLPPSDRSPWS